MMRIQIKELSLKSSAIIELLERGYRVVINNKDGDCLYVWTDGSKKAELSHWTNDNPVLVVDNDHYRWFVNCL